MIDLPYLPYSAQLKARGFSGYRIRKVTLNGGFTCPNLDGSKARGGCTFCDNRSFSPSAGDRSVDIGEQLRKGIEYKRSRAGNRGNIREDRFIAYFQTYSGTYAPVDRLRSLYTQALAHPEVIGISIGTRPDCITPEIADLLEEIGSRTFLTLELGLQSAHDESLIRINRAHGFREFAEAMDLCSGRGFDLCVHLILGLPGEMRWHFRSTARAAARWRFQSIKIHPLHAVKGTELGRQFLRNEFRPLLQQEYVSGLVDVLERIPSDVAVQRFTGDAPAGMLLAPTWCSRKTDIQKAMLSEFARRKTRQGSAMMSWPEKPTEKAGLKEDAIVRTADIG